MTHNTDRARAEKMAVLNGLAGNFSATLSPETSKLWLFLLADYSVAQVQAAALAMIRRCGTDETPYRTMPPFALLQRELDALLGTVRGEQNLRLQAIAEWGLLLEAIQRHGAYREPVFSQTTAYCVRALGGWTQICRWRTDELPWRERDFVTLWEQSHGKTDILNRGCSAVAALANSQHPNSLTASPRQPRHHTPQNQPLAPPEPHSPQTGPAKNGLPSSPSRKNNRMTQ